MRDPNDTLLKPGKKSIQSIGFFACFTHRNFIACCYVLIFGAQKNFP